MHLIATDILHLMRGYCYDITGYRFWVFGGGNSIDKRYRIPEISWWQQEMPNVEDYRRGLKCLEDNQFCVDYILTHTVPQSIAKMICEEIIPGEEPLQEYLENVSEKVEFKQWYFGHWHMDVDVFEKYHGLMEEVVCLCKSK